LERVCVLYAEESASDLVKQLHSKTKDVFIKEAGKNVSQWWNQSGQSGEAAKIQKEWKDNNTNKKFGAPDSTQEGPATKRQTEVGPDTAPRVNITKSGVCAMPQLELEGLDLGSGSSSSPSSSSVC